MKPIYRIIAAFLIGPVLYMSVAFTVFKTECLHSGKVGWDIYEPIECFGLIAEQDEEPEAEEAHSCCHKHKKTEESSCHSTSSEAEKLIKGKCCTNEMISGYVEVESLVQDSDDIKPVSFDLFWVNILPETASFSKSTSNLELACRPPPRTVGEQLSTLQVYRL